VNQIVANYHLLLIDNYDCWK